MLAFEPELLSAKGAASGVQYYSAADYHEMYKSGKVTPLQVAQAILSATKSPAYEDAWADSHGADGLALQAAKESTQRYAEGKPLGVLDGVPIGVKDDTAVKGYINHFGLKYRGDLSFFKPSETSSWPVLKLQEAGAVVIGKNRMHEVGSGTSAPVYIKL
jgi:Asp-tRNA(Asn)/Glu-tRNA(Gln) amidotransferase A subunit family amidase